MIETGFGKEFSEPPNVAVSAERTHCEACQEPLDPNVMHKCHGNKHYEPPVFSSTEITARCPECETGEGVLLSLPFYGVVECVVVCRSCRRYLYPLVSDSGKAIANWNEQAATGKKGCWPLWRAALPGDDERSNSVVSKPTPAHPDLTNYQGACPAVHVEGEVCDWCENTGTIPPTKGEAK